MGVEIHREEGGRIGQVLLAAGKGNILDSKLIAGVEEALDALGMESGLRCVVLGATGPHFCFGASVEEHQPAQVHQMLPRFHALVRTLLRYPVPVVAAVRGQCLGGGLEVALATHRIIAHPSARFGQPEIKLGVFAPAASALLPERVGQARAEQLLWAGEAVTAQDALAMGLVDQVCAEAEDPLAAATRYAREAFGTLSSSSLRFAVQAARERYANRVSERLADVEHLYLASLADSPDAKEGIAAFLEKRAPRWRTEGGAR